MLQPIVKPDKPTVEVIARFGSSQFKTRWLITYVHDSYHHTQWLCKRRLPMSVGDCTVCLHVDANGHLHCFS